MIASFFASVTAWVYRMFTANQTTEMSVDIENCAGNAEEQQHDSTPAPIKEQVVVDLESEINENRINNDFLDLLYLDELFPDSEKFSTPIKELQRISNVPVPVDDQTPTLDDMTELASIATTGLVTPSEGSTITEQCSKKKCCLYAFISMASIVFIAILLLVIRKFFELLIIRLIIA